MGKLATIQIIHRITPIAGADSIELVHVLGWQCVTKKGEFAINEMCVYFEVDAFLPIDDRFEFLRKSSYRKSECVGEGFRIKSMRMRGRLSQGLAMPVELFPEVVGAGVGEDVTKLLGVRKWEVPEMSTTAGTIIGSMPYSIPKTDETRVQSLDILRRKMLGRPYYISTKMDGTSCSFYVKEGVVGCCGRNNEYGDDGKCSFWNWAHEHRLPEKMIALSKKLGYDFVLQGEFCGAGIQKNRLRLMKPEWFVFTAIRFPTMSRLGYDEMCQLADEIGVLTVPIEERGESFNYTLDELLEKARGKYPSGLDKEGIVVRPLTPEYLPELGLELSFKVLNNDFLLKE